MIPSNLKIGDTYSRDGLTFEVIGFDYEGRYVAKRVVGVNSPTPVAKSVEVKTETKGEYDSMGIKELQALCKEKGLP